MSILKYTFNILFVFAALAAYAQKPLPGTDIPEVKDFRPTGLKLSYDIIPLGESLFEKAKQGQHFQASIDFYNYFLVAEYGVGSTSRGTDSTYSYANEGWYWRVGPEVNFLKNDKKGNSLTFGLRFAQSYFSDEIAFQTDSYFGNDLDIASANPAMKATWAEMTAGLNVHVWKGLYMGYTIRYKLFRKVKGIGDFSPYDIPGWGQTRNQSAAGFSYFIGWIIPLREKFPEEKLEK